MPVTPETIAALYAGGKSITMISKECHIGKRSVVDAMNSLGIPRRPQICPQAKGNQTRFTEMNAKGRRTCTQCGRYRIIDHFPLAGPLTEICYECMEGWEHYVRICPVCGHARLWWTFITDALTVVHRECRICRTQNSGKSSLLTINKPVGTG